MFEPSTDPLETMPVGPHARGLRRVLRLWATVLLIFLWSPIVLLVLFSFENSRAVGLPFTGVTLHWYEELLDDRPLLTAVANTVIVAITVAALATLVGTMAAFVLVRSGLARPNVGRILITMPIMFPGVLIGTSLLIFLAGSLKLDLSLTTVVLGHLVITTPFVVLIVATRLHGFDRSLEWAAADLGASPRRVLRHIILPLISSAILAGALISVTLSIDEFVVTYFTIGPQLTLPIYIYTQTRFGATPEVNAAATLMMIGTIGVLGLATLTFSQRGRLRRSRRWAPGDAPTRWQTAPSSRRNQANRRHIAMPLNHDGCTRIDGSSFAIVCEPGAQ